ncbi:Uma2 family endonuclease [Niabella sp. CC-SYL272]|uniref:Uma2 family endonuclease n=1 Tax=Niabella agricola TaxID=2891571 RepID=UPI001F43B316|nr:Uma2 family endonuclease [Niabella agricola]MCF3109089.1 Uma2 family endonuclease [Niabella agricola]
MPHYTYDDWVHWEGRRELIDGIPIAMGPMPQPKHQRVAVEIRYAFINTLKACSCQQCHSYDRWIIRSLKIPFWFRMY